MFRVTTSLQNVVLQCQEVDWEVDQKLGGISSGKKLTTFSAMPGLSNIIVYYLHAISSQVSYW